jgi:AcrR family transcriptional regulator
MFFLTLKREFKMKDSIRKRIVEKARDILFTKTQDELTMNLVASELGITAPTLYHYFEGKDEMIRAAYDLIQVEINETMGIKFPMSIPIEMRIITITNIIAEYIMRTGVPASVIVENPMGNTIDLRDFREKVKVMFAEYLKKKGMKDDVDITTLRYLAIIQADIAYLRSAKKQLPEDFSEKVFKGLFG